MAELTSSDVATAIDEEGGGLDVIGETPSESERILGDSIESSFPSDGKIGKLLELMSGSPEDRTEAGELLMEDPQLRGHVERMARVLDRRGSTGDSEIAAKLIHKLVTHRDTKNVIDH